MPEIGQDGRGARLDLACTETVSSESERWPRADFGDKTMNRHRSIGFVDSSVPPRVWLHSPPTTTNQTQKLSFRSVGQPDDDEFLVCMQLKEAECRRSSARNL